LSSVGAYDRFGVDAAQLGDRLGDARDVRRLVSLSPVGNRSKEGAVRLDEQRSSGTMPRHLLQVECARKRHDACERDMKAEIERTAAIGVSPVKQWNTPPTSAACSSSRIVNVSASASRV
jgi:hypothetical protein